MNYLSKNVVFVKEKKVIEKDVKVVSKTLVVS